MVALRHGLIILACVGLCGCSAPNEETMWELVRACNRHDVERAADLFTDDAVIVLPDGAVIEGRERIHDYLEWRRAVRAQIGIYDVEWEGEILTASAVDTSELNWLVAWPRMHLPELSVRYRAGRIARLDLGRQRPYYRRELKKKTREFEEWMRGNRPGELARVRDDGRWQVTPGIAQETLRILEAWRKERVPERLTVRVVESTLPFGVYPRFELTLHNGSAETVTLVADGTPPRDSYLQVGSHITDGDGVVYGPLGMGIPVKPGERLPPGEEKQFRYPLDWAVPREEYYRTQAGAMPPGEYRFRLSMVLSEPGHRVLITDEGSFRVTDDGSPELAHLLNARNGVGLEDLRLKIERKGQSIVLVAINTGTEELAIGDAWAWHLVRPSGPYRQTDGVRSNAIMVIPPGERQGLQSLRFSEVGLNTATAVYHTADGRPAKKSNTISVIVHEDGQGHVSFIAKWWLLMSMP